MTNKTILAFAFLDAYYRKSGAEFRLWHELPENDTEQHLITAELFTSNQEMTAKDTHEAWVKRRLADGWQQSFELDSEKNCIPNWWTLNSCRPGLRKPKRQQWTRCGQHFPMLEKTCFHLTSSLKS